MAKFVFRVIDKQTNRDVTGSGVLIAKTEEWAKHLYIEGGFIDWFVTSHGELGLVDTNGEVAYAPNDDVADVYSEREINKYEIKIAPVDK